MEEEAIMLYFSLSYNFPPGRNEVNCVQACQDSQCPWVAPEYKLCVLELSNQL
jgi:hypothetical protein